MSRSISGARTGAVGLALCLCLLRAVATGPVIVAPNQAGGPVGAIANLAHVTTWGSAAYDMTLPVPPGVEGRVSPVRLNYDSQNGNGEAGMGWSMAHPSAITRCEQTIARDGRNTGVDLSADDAYCFDAVHLVRVAGTNGGDAEFRAEGDAALRIHSYGGRPDLGPERWVIDTQDGQRLDFGGLASNATWRSGDRRLRWNETRQADAQGNFMRLDYVSRAGEQPLLASVGYDGNERTGQMPYASVDFVYETRPDATEGWYAGVHYTGSRRLARIETHLDPADRSAFGVLVRRWTLAYASSAATGRSLLRSITDCGADGVCLQPTHFDWTGREPMGEPPPGSWGGPVMTPGRLGPESASNTLAQQVFVADIDGDGRQDLVVSTGSGTWDVCLSTGRAFACTAQDGLPKVAADSFLSGDFEGAGRTDILIPPPPGARQGWNICRLHDGKFVCTPFATAFASPGRDPADYLLADFTGDGRADLVVIDARPGRSMLCPSTGNALGPCRPWEAAPVRYPGTTPRAPHRERPRWLVARSGNIVTNF